MILACHHISKSFSEHVVLADASFVIEAHEKAAIVGINGAGKSTLLRIITGELKPDDGEVILSSGATMGYLAQQHVLSGTMTIYEEMEDAKKDVIAAEEKLRELEGRMKELRGEALEKVMEQYHALSSWFELHDGYAVRSEIAGVLKGLGFSEEDFHRHTETLSGGQKTRVGLAKLLLSVPDLILLDEPTNHLDMNSIAWLETYLKTYRGAVVIVAHDRYFLDRVVTKVIEIDQGHVMTFMGNYTDYAQKKQQLINDRIKAWMNQQARIRHEEEVITKLKSFNREKSIRRAESREKMLEKIDVIEKPQQADTSIHLRLEPDIESGNDVLKVSDLSKAFEEPLFEHLSFEIKRSERVALIGDNGTGKTTILKIINGLEEADSGTVSLGAKVHIGYYDQEHQVLHAQKTLFEEISDDFPDLTNTRIRNILAAFLFTGDDVFKKVGDLSGGERGRVSLAKLMLSKANFLILDEPTNHLDIYSRQILENALNAYTGTVLYVSHDRYFINQTATRILELADHRLTGYLGNYDYYLEKKEELAAARAAATPGPSDQKAASPAPDSSGSRQSWEAQKEQQALARRRENELKKTEDRISQLEEEDRQIDQKLSLEEVYTDLQQVTDLTSRKADISRELDALYERWEALSE